MIQRIVRLHFHPENTAAFEAIFAESKDRIRATAGCLHVECWRDVNDPDAYYTYSRWENEAALNGYRHSDFFRATWTKTKALFKAKPEAFSANKLAALRSPVVGIQELAVADYHLKIGEISDHHFSWLSERAYAGWVIITDERTQKYCLPKIKSWLSHNDAPQVYINIPDGEHHKHLDTCRFIWEEMFRAGVGRRWCVLNLGGGVVGDMGGFAAATYKRGLDFIQIPTTLLSQVDASVGGKLGIDFFEIKNSIGVFRNPQAVWIDPTFLATLPLRELRSGYAEVIKHALIADASQWADLLQITSLDKLKWGPIIRESVAIKQAIVEADPEEKGLRKALNFGHTIGHAIESYFLNREDRLLHGEAIAAGFIAEAWISTKIAGLTPASLAQISQYILAIYGHQIIPASAWPELLALMLQDKKNDDHRINFTLINEPGQAIVNATAEPTLIRAAIQYYNDLAEG